MIPKLKMSKDVDHIIWISDIHIKSQLDDGSTPEVIINQFAKVFKEKIMSLSINPDKTTYVIVTGDISFSSEDDQYAHIKIVLKSMIPTEYHKAVKFIWCSGNHDASWEGFETNYHRLGSEISAFFGDRNNSYNGTLNKQKIDFDKIFQHYSRNLAYKYNDDQGMFHIKNTAEIVVSKRYYKTGLEGQVIDHRQKTIFTIINTSWYSRGHSLQSFLSNFGDNLSKEDQLKLIEQSQESGKLITGLLAKNTKLKAQDLLSTLIDEKHNDYFKITLMHHPMDWLNPSEIHSYNPNMQKKGTLITQIFRASSVLLTGHVHPSRANRIEFLYDLDLIHLRAPMLVNHYGANENDVRKLFPCNGFGVFTVNRRLRKFYLQYYDSYFPYDAFEIRESNDTPSTSYIKTTENKDKTLGNPGAKESLEVKYSNVENTDNFNLQKFVNDYTSENKPIIVTNHFNVYVLDESDCIKVLICPKNNDCCVDLAKMKSNEFDVPSELIAHLLLGKKISRLTMLIPGTYLRKNNDHEENQMLKMADDMLNRLRTNFYNYIEHNIDQNKGIQDFFIKVEACQFNVVLMQSNWFYR